MNALSREQRQERPRLLSNVELRDISTRHKREGQRYDDLSMCLTHIELLFAQVEELREALMEIRDGQDIDQFGVSYYKAGERARKLARKALAASSEGEGEK